MATLRVFGSLNFAVYTTYLFGKLIYANIIDYYSNGISTSLKGQFSIAMLYILPESTVHGPSSSCDLPKMDLYHPTGQPGFRVQFQVPVLEGCSSHVLDFVNDCSAVRSENEQSNSPEFGSLCI